MRFTRIWLAGLLLGGVTVEAVHCEVSAQTWQAAAATEDKATPVDWQQRVLKRPQQPLEWQPARPADFSEQPEGPSPTAGQSPQATSSRQTARRTSYERNAFDRTASTNALPSREPAVTGRQRAKWVQNEEIIEPGITQYEPLASEGTFAGTSGCATCGGPDGGCGCEPCGTPACDDCDFGWEEFDGRCGGLLRGLSVFAGGDAFKGPVDHGRNGNFGLNEGLNLAAPLGDPWGFGYQLGANFVQSNFSGAPLATIDDHQVLPADRHQTFLTAAVFRRALCGGLQGGVAFDYLRDDYYEQADLQQIRSETGWVIDDSYEIGYYGAYGVGTARTWDGKLDPTDMFVLYGRRYFETGGDGRIWAGATGNGDALLGADIWVPLGKSFALENRINYLIPKVNKGESAQPQESWGLTIQLVWYPGGKALCQRQNPYRAMFNVADNSLFMVDRLTNR
jgi:hypothetical protein